ncbi:MAG: thiaminase II [Bryobacteraceae bacterium]
MTALLALLLFAPLGKVTDEMWLAAKPVYLSTLDHPFLKGLADGSLPREKFIFYLEQDALFLGAYGNALTALARKAPTREWEMKLMSHVTESLASEQQLHRTLLAGRPKAQMAPSNQAYTNHLIDMVNRGTFAEGLAAMLPCYWIYWEVGKDLQRRGSKNPDYQKWIDQYSSPGYADVVKDVLTLMNAEAAWLDKNRRWRLVRLFVEGAHYEYMFWDMAWRLEKWRPKP